MKRPAKVKRVAKDLIETWLLHNRSEDKIRFSTLCDSWIQKRKQDIQQYTVDQQEWIDAIEEAYKKYMELGEERFIENYGKLNDTFSIAYEDILYRRAGKKPPKRHLVVRDEYKPANDG